jgi:hypothetical protein
MGWRRSRAPSIEVRRSVKNDLDGGWVAGPPKTHQERRIALDHFTVEALTSEPGKCLQSDPTFA